MIAEHRVISHQAALDCSILSLFVFSPHSLKMEIEKLANEKTEMQRHYVMVGSPLSA